MHYPPAAYDDGLLSSHCFPQFPLAFSAQYMRAGLKKLEQSGQS